MLDVHGTGSRGMSSNGETLEIPYDEDDKAPRPLG
jgi:hypothetical protein